MIRRTEVGTEVYGGSRRLTVKYLKSLHLRKSVRKSTEVRNIVAKLLISFTEVILRKYGSFPILRIAGGGPYRPPRPHLYLVPVGKIGRAVSGQIVQREGHSPEMENGAIRGAASVSFGKQGRYNGRR